MGVKSGFTIKDKKTGRWHSVNNKGYQGSSLSRERAEKLTRTGKSKRRIPHHVRKL